jgi:simple sugar transport system ATP-binding protein
VRLNGRDVTNRKPREVRSAGAAHIPEDRRARGLIGAFTVAENLVLGKHHLPPYSRLGVLSRESVREHAERLIREHDLRPDDPDALASDLSGGNQQKLIVARELDGRPALLVASQPTRGVDIGAVEFVHKSLIAMRDAGAGVLLVSAELSEIIGLSDRIAVMFRGALTRWFEAERAGVEEIGLAMTGGCAEASA